MNTSLCCCFTGHRMLTAQEETNIKRQLETEIRKLIAKEVTCFLAGGAIGFDMLAAQTVLRLKQSYPQIRLVLVLPCHNHTVGWSQPEKDSFAFISKHADETHYTAESFYVGCLHKRNRFLVDNAAYCLCYLKRQQGGTAYTVLHALKKKRNIIYLY